MRNAAFPHCLVVFSQECLSVYVEVSSSMIFISSRKLTFQLKGICAGKHAIAEYLIQHQGFQLLELRSKAVDNIGDESDDHLRFQASEIRKTDETQSEFVFETANELLDFVTKRWRERWVTTDVTDGETLERFILRPFFLLVSVDAPVSLRWKRFSDRLVAPCCTQSS